MKWQNLYLTSEHWRNNHFLCQQRTPRRQLPPRKPSCVTGQWSAASPKLFFPSSARPPNLFEHPMHFDLPRTLFLTLC